jgi:hypothetical protein
MVEMSNGESGQNLSDFIPKSQVLSYQDPNSSEGSEGESPALCFLVELEDWGVLGSL